MFLFLTLDLSKKDQADTVKKDLFGMGRSIFEVL